MFAWLSQILLRIYLNVCIRVRHQHLFLLSLTGLLLRFVKHASLFLLSLKQIVVGGHILLGNELVSLHSLFLQRL